jgi:hypothetical protein
MGQLWNRTVLYLPEMGCAVSAVLLNITERAPVQNVFNTSLHRCLISNSCPVAHGISGVYRHIAVLHLCQYFLIFCVAFVRVISVTYSRSEV